MSNRYKAAVLTLILATMIISGCSDGNAPAVTTAAETESTSAQTTTSAPEEADNSATDTEITDTAVYNDYKLVLGDGKVKYSSSLDQNFLIVHATFTNTGEPEYAAACFAVRAFQNDIGIDYNVNGIDDTDTNISTEIKDGASIEVTYCFPVTDMSDVEVLVRTPTASRDTIGQKIYKLSEMQPEESEPDEPAPKQAEKDPAPEADGQTYITSLRDAFHSYTDASGEFEEALQSDDFDTVDTALDNMENALHEIENAPHPAKYSEMHEKLSAATEDEMHYVGLCRKFAGYVEKRDELTESDNEELQKLTNEMGEFNSDFLQVFSEIVKTVAADLG